MAGGGSETKHYAAPSGGWGSLKGMAQAISREHPTAAVFKTLLRQNKPKGFMCSSCAWGKPAHSHIVEFCENGAKSTIWD
jgi:hypothetical protein